MPIFSIEGRSNISTNKYDILILPSTLFICLIPSFKEKEILTRTANSHRLTGSPDKDPSVTW